MIVDLITQLTALLDHWNTTVAEAAKKVAETSEPVQGAYYAGVMFGMESARDELAAAMANGLAEVAQS